MFWMWKTLGNHKRPFTAWLKLSWVSSWYTHSNKLAWVSSRYTHSTKLAWVSSRYTHSNKLAWVSSWYTHSNKLAWVSSWYTHSNKHRPLLFRNDLPYQLKTVTRVPFRALLTQTAVSQQDKHFFLSYETHFTETCQKHVTNVCLSQTAFNHFCTWGKRKISLFLLYTRGGGGN